MRNVSAPARYQGYGVRFFECAAVPEAVLAKILDGEVTEDTRRVFSQWRIDVPPPADPPIRSVAEEQVLTVAGKILTRGRLTLCSPRLERSLRRKFLRRSRRAEESALCETMFLSPPGGDLPGDQRMAKYIQSVRFSHRLEIALLEALRSGFLPMEDRSPWIVLSDIDMTGWFDRRESDFILALSVRDLRGLIRNILRLYSVRRGGNGRPPAKGVSISFSGKADVSLPTCFVEDVSMPFHIANSVSRVPPGVLRAPSRRALLYLLRYIFRKPAFWEGQLEGVSRTLRGKDSIILLPTGAGKSIVFQLSGLLLPGSTIVIDPIISLMEDQTDNLRSAGIDRVVAITSQIDDPSERARVLELFGQGEYLFAYVAPERFQTDGFRQALRTLTAGLPVSLIAVDEAHCVSEWGHDFRTAYLNIGRTSRACCSSGGITPPLLALTGTASRAVLKDIQRELRIEEYDAIVTPRSFDRPELMFRVSRCPSKKKSAVLLAYLGQTLPETFARTRDEFFRQNGQDTCSGLVFCPHVNGEFGVHEISRRIRTSLGIEAACYSGKEPRLYLGDDWTGAKQETARRFKHNRVPLLVCTSAFGMGIDKPNIRFTVHFGIPRSIESFYQEAGRAGRDRRTAYCSILASVDDPERAAKLLDPGTSPEDISAVLERTDWSRSDDVTRAVYFQTKAFPGVAQELSNVAAVLEGLGDPSSAGVRILALPRLVRAAAEKAIHRLLVLGVITDYTIDYRTEEFTVTLSGAGRDSVIGTYGDHVAGYLPARRAAEVEKARTLLGLPAGEFVLGMAGILLRFVYDVIERGRRRALSEMLLAATSSPDGASVRSRILRYLESTQYSEALEAVITDAGLEKAREILETVDSANEAAELRGQVSRYLESYPDHPGLLLLRALSESGCRDGSREVTKENFHAAVSSAVGAYAVDSPALFDVLAWATGWIAGRDSALAGGLQETLFRRHPERMLARAFILHSPLQLAVRHARFLISALAEQSQQLLEEAHDVPRERGIPGS